ncbi:MAG: response regulator [Defluviitaleaceae bacterium]|nr:response regulator [Defluviitaleaceae bacterium]
MISKSPLTKERRRKTLAYRSRILYIVVPIISLGLLAAINAIIYRNLVAYSVRNMALQYSVEAAANFQTGINPHFTLMQQIASSATIGRWLANEYDQDLKRNAFYEIVGHARFSPETRLMFTVYDSRRGYDFYVDLDFNEFMYWGILEGGEVSQWFYDTRDHEIPFILNIQRDRYVDYDYDYDLLVWANHRIMYQDQFVGVVTVGFDFETIFDAVFGVYDYTMMRGYIIDRYGLVRSDSAQLLQVTEAGLPILPIIPESVYNPALYEHIQTHLNRLQNGLFLPGTYSYGVVDLTAGSFSNASISPIIGTDWSLVILSNPVGTLADFAYVVLLIAVIIVLAIMITVYGYWIHRFIITPLHNLTGSIFVETNANSNPDYTIKVYGLDRQDEIGDVARAIDTMKNNLKESMENASLLELAEEKNKAKSDFLAKMSHEIRTPITAVLGISEIELGSSELPPYLEKSFSRIHDSAQMLLGIVNGILDLSKIEAGKMEIMNDRYHISSLISDTSHISAVYIGDKKIDFAISVDENLPQAFFGDALRIAQIVNNLLSNSFKYTRSGSVKLSYEYKAIEGDMGNIVITVADTGMGMSDEQLQHLNEEYTRFHEQEMRNVEGTGLGMPIVYNLTNMMDAVIKVTSELGKGTSVEVSIPQKVSNSTPIGPKLAHILQRFETLRADKRSNVEPEPMPYGSVLVVDDVDANIFVAKGLLKFYDIHVDTANSGEAAIEKIKSHEKYDIVFLDHMLPGLNGTETMKEIRKLGYTGAIVSFTANALIDQAQKSIEDGFDDFVSKPILLKELNKVLVEHVKNKYPADVIEAAKKAKKYEKRERKTIENHMESSEIKEALMREFVKTQKDTFSEISTAIDNGDTKAALLLAHSLKGISYLINEDTLAEVAAKVENSLLKSSSVDPAHMQSLEQHLNSVLNNIKLPETKGAVNEVEKEKVLAIFDKLEPLLASNNSECLFLVEELSTIPETAVMIKKIESFDFSTALEDLKILRDVLIGT